MWRRHGFPPRWGTLVGDEGGEEDREEGEEEEGEDEGAEEGEEIMLPLLLLLPTPHPPRSPRAEMMYGCKGHMLAA